ncbi:ATP-binding cassette domain-containing protein [Paenarthrobacter sp. NPDC091669]|uniref:ATP-binding cassette domain-containing protein n=1 Tax=Paenarthrobacter sp. NPDC091669 TaxID=3364384 RepID=UPI00381E6232
MSSPSQTLPEAEPLLRITDLTVDYSVGGFGRKRTFRALQGVSLDIKAGETLGLVGESGSGKSTIGRAVLGLAPVTGGDIRFDGRSITKLAKKERRALSSDIQVVFQDPYTSLNPSMTISDILSEPMQVSGTSKVDAQRRVRELLDVVNLPSNSSARYPREFSGGQRQRIAIARSLCRNPKLIVCDEPVSALDLSTQARVLQLFSDIQEQTGVSLLFVTHDLDVVRHISERVAVMRRGEIVETGITERVIANPHHAYTKALLLASPIANPARQAERRRERRLFLDAQPALSTAAR